MKKVSMIILAAGIIGSVLVNAATSQATSPYTGRKEDALATLLVISASVSGVTEEWAANKEGMTLEIMANRLGLLNDADYDLEVRKKAMKKADSDLWKQVYLSRADIFLEMLKAFNKRTNIEGETVKEETPTYYWKVRSRIAAKEHGWN